MPRSDSRLRHRVATALLVFQVAVPAALPPIELGLWDARSSGAHVEQADTDDCAPPHDEARCPICQTITHRVAVPGPAFLPPRAAEITGGSRAQAGQPHRAAALRLGRPRAPPPLRA